MRMSFLGGGTDFFSWFTRNPGVVVGAAIDKYAYIGVRRRPRYHGKYYRASYSQVEEFDRPDECQQPIIKACLEAVSWPKDDGLEIFHQSDLPSNSGTGSSSAFCVGLLIALTALRGEYLSPEEAAQLAISVERYHLDEKGGWQDQYWSAYGGVRQIFFDSHAVTPAPLVTSKERLDELLDHLVLCYTRVKRHSSAILANCQMTDEQGWAMREMAQQGARAILAGDWRQLGRLIDQSWRIKCSLSPEVCPPDLGSLYGQACVFGAWGGKLMGAGGGGCFLLVVPPAKRQKVIDRMVEGGCIPVPFRFVHDGARVIFHGG
jgi:D-glycero-alpha-D-manno-heptose-7-phosphate kinase